MMANRRHSVRHVRKRYTYNVREAAKVTGATPGTVRRWRKNGLEPVAGVYPTIFLGEDIIAYFDRVKAARKRPCGPGLLYCFRCKAAKRPAFDEVEFWPDGPKLGTISGLCPDCATTMNRRVSRSKLSAVVGDLKLTIQEESRLAGTLKPNGNDESERG